MKTLRFQGFSDDTFGEYGETHYDYDNCASMKPIQCLVQSKSENAGLLVVGQYAKTHPTGGCWVIGVSMMDEDEKIPTWPIRYTDGKYGYSPILEIDVPDDFTLIWYSNGNLVAEVE